MEERFNFSNNYIKIRMIGGKIYIEVWEQCTVYLRLQVPLSHYEYIIYNNDFIVRSRNERT